MTFYDVQESARQTNQWLGATAKAFWRNPVFSLSPNPLPAIFAAWGEVTERSFERISATPDWAIDNIATDDGDYVVNLKTEIDKPFCKLIHFSAERDRPVNRRILLIAPMSGHYATLVRKTVISLLPNCNVWVTEWKNARDVPVSQGNFDVEDYTKYIAEFMTYLGEDLHVIAVCQPAPLTLAATAMLAGGRKPISPKTLTLIGGPVDPAANPSKVTDFGSSVNMSHLETSMIQPVGFSFAGVGRKVYPGSTQLASFMAMNSKLHSGAFLDQIGKVAAGESADHDRHNAFYDEYLAVMDMPAEFYLSTVERVFKAREIAKNEFTVDGKKIDITKIKKTAVMIVEGGRDDISAPGQCRAALELLPHLRDDQKEAFLEPEAGHYGIFSGSAWRNNIRPAVLKFIDLHNAMPKRRHAKTTQ